MIQNRNLILSVLETIPKLYPEKYKAVIEALPENRKTIMKYCFHLFDQPSLKKEPLAPGFATPDFKALFNDDTKTYYSDLMEGKDDDICKKYSITENQFTEILLNYLEELYSSLNKDFTALSKEFYSSLETSGEKILDFSDFAFLGNESLAQVINNMEFSDLLFIIYRLQEPVKAEFVKALFNKYKTVKEKIYLIEDFFFSPGITPVNLYNYTLKKSDYMIDLKPLVESGKIKLPQNLIFPTEEYLNKKNLELEKISKEKENSIEVTDFLYMEERSIARFLKNEEIPDQDFYALLYKYRNTELAYTLSMFLTKEFKNEIPKYNSYFSDKPDECEERINNLKKYMIKMNNDDLLNFYSNGLWITATSEIVYLDSQRHVVKYDNL